MQHIQTYITIAALAAPILLAAGSSKASAQESSAAASPKTETTAAPGCPEHDPALPASPSQEELARDIRTIVTGVKSLAQQEALAQAARLAPGHMNDALREVLVDAAAFVNYLHAIRKPPNARLDSLSRLLACTLQPHFSQEELTSDILSINSYDEQGHRLPENQARQKIAAWLVAHIPPGEMMEELQRATIDGVLNIGREFYGMYTTWNFLSEALLKQYAEHSDADLAAEIRRARAEEDVNALLVAIHVVVRWQGPGGGYIGNPDNIGPESMAAMLETLAWLNERANERIGLLEQRAVAGDKEAQEILQMGYREDTWYRVHRMLSDAVFGIAKHIQIPEILEILAGSSEGDFSNDLDVFGDRGVVPIVNVLSGRHVHTALASTGLNNLANIVGASKRADREPLSPDHRILLVDMAHRFLAEDGLQNFRGLAGARQILDTAIRLAIALDEPDLMQIVDALASNREEAIDRGFSAEEAEHIPEDIQRQKRWKAEAEARQAQWESEEADMSQPESGAMPFSQDELVIAIQAITKGERGKRQVEALRQVTKMAEADLTQIRDTLRSVIEEAFFEMFNDLEKPAWDDMEAETYYGILNTLENAIISVGDTETAKLFIELNAYEYKCVGTVSEYLFKKFPDQSIPRIIKSISWPGQQSEKIPVALYILAEIVIDYKRGWLDISQNNRHLLIAMTQRFLEEDIARSWTTRGNLNSYSDSNVLSAAIDLAIALDDPGLIDILHELATNPDKITVLGFSEEHGENFQESIKWHLNQRPYMGPSDC